ncbi:MAG TPA: histidine phosphatase family protein [Devosiaceae bacterium]|jgi:probable phosphoglycerate mutase|nr:histidine phosphatase family protein [Devosiaceae bacterium]
MRGADWPEIYFIRHGQTNWNAEGRYQGARDIPLNDVGRGQADENGRLLGQLLARAGRSPADFAWYVSPLGRTRETMDRVRAQLPPPLPVVTIDPRLTEISFGIYEGRLHTELAAGEMAIAGERDAGFWHFRPPDGESYADLAERVADFGRSLGGPAIIVAHGGLLRVLMHLIEGYDHEKTVNWFPPQDSVVHFLDGRAVVYPAGASWDD